MTKKVKYTLLLALFCSTQVHMHAGWGSQFLSIVKIIYPFNMVHQAYGKCSEIAASQKTKTNNEEVQKSYPRAFAYLQKELLSIGIDPKNVQIANCQELTRANSGWRKLEVPLSIIENESPESQRAANQAKALIAHEVEHIRRHTVAKIPVVCALITAGMELGRPHLPTLRSFIPEILIKTLISHAFLQMYRHHEEHCADYAAIKRFKKDRQTLLDTATFWLNVHQNTAKNFVFQPFNPHKQQIELSRWYNPIKNRWIYRLLDTHESNFYRANRFIKAAGLPCSQWVLARALKQQMINYLSNFSENWTKLIDASFVIEELKKVNVEKSPTHSKPMGQ